MYFTIILNLFVCLPISLIVLSWAFMVQFFEIDGVIQRIVLGEFGED